MKRPDKIIVGTLLVILLLGFSFSIYQFAKQFNYSFMYEGMVKQTITDMVKQEALK